MNPDYSIHKDGDGNRIALGKLIIKVRNEGETNLVNRRVMCGNTPWYTTLVATMDGVKVYIRDNGEIEITKQDLY